MKNIIIYDFDGTLTPYPMPKFEVLEQCGIKDGASNPMFINLARKKAVEKKIDLYEAVYETYLEILINNGKSLTNENFTLGSKNVQYNNGVINFLRKVKQHKIKNYLLSSGIKVFLDKVSIAPYFEEIYATTFTYNQNHEAVGINFLMNDKNKIEAIKKILEKNDISKDDCTKIIYIGDGLSDFYAMNYVKKYGGVAILVFLNPLDENILKMKEKNMADYYIKADFSDSSELTKYVQKLCKIKEKN